jgi:nucleotide-binding universal stress UspA family protein
MIIVNTHKITCEGIIDAGCAKLAIINKAKELGADLIVCGSHGLSLFGRVLSFDHPELGSVSRYLVSRAPCDVFVVKPEHQ